MRIAVISDCHGRLPEIPECDVLLNAGDICPDFGWDPDLAKLRQTEWLGDVYRVWEDSVPANHILATPGNHDWVMAFPDCCRSQMFIDAGVELYDGPKMIGRWPKPLGTSTLHPVKTFWFTPWVAHCGDWNYQASRDQRRYYFDNIPRKLDMLVHHAPAFGVGDLTYGNEPVGCYEMKAVIQKQQPRYSCFGHIHEGVRYGREYRLGGTKMFHASMWGDKWKPIVLDI